MNGRGTLGDGSVLASSGMGRTGSPRRLVTLLVAAAMLAALVWSLLPDGDGGLAERVLAGPRGPSCVRMVIAVDVSGSMSDYAGARDSALGQLVGWSRGNLRPDDELAVIDFAESAAIRLPVTRVDALPAGAASSAIAVPDGRTTNLAPVLDRVREQPGGRCDRALLLLSDAQLADLPATVTDGRTALSAHDVHDADLLVPGEDIDVPAQWTTAFPAAAPIRFDGHDTDDTAVAFGEAVAVLTGQELETR